MDIKRNILLNPGPATTTDSVKLAQVVPDICPREKEFAALLRGIRNDLLKVVHADPQLYTCVPFCGSGTICMDISLNSLLPEGKKILIVMNGAYSRRAADICRCYGLLHTVLSFPYDRQPALDEVERALQADPDIAIVYATHNETGSGLLNPIRSLGELAHRYGAILIADTTSTYAMRPVDIQRDQIDFCMASSQKGLMGMTGLSFLIGRTAEVVKSADYPKRSYYCNLFQQYDCFEKTGEMQFTPPVQTVYALRRALDEYFEEGEERKWARHKRVFEAIHNGLERLGFQDVIRREWQAGLVVSVKYPDDPGWDFERIHDYCYERGFTIYPGKIASADTFRLCALGAIDTADIEAFFSVFEEALTRYRISLPVHYRTQTTE